MKLCYDGCVGSSEQYIILFMSDVPGDPGSQLPYQEFPPYYLAPIWLGFPLEIQLGLGAFLSLSLSLVLAHNGRG